MLEKTAPLLRYGQKTLAESLHSVSDRQETLPGDEGRHIASQAATTHVTELWVARLRVWDRFRSMLAVNSTLLSDDPGLKHFDAQE